METGKGLKLKGGESIALSLDAGGSRSDSFIAVVMAFKEPVYKFK